MNKIRFLFFKLATNWQSDKGFLLTSKVCPQGVLCPCPGAIYMYKIIKNVYKIRFWRDHFETCNIWAKRKGLSVVIKILSPMCCLPLLREKHEKMCLKSDFKDIVLKLATNGQSGKGFLLTSTFGPSGLSVPVLGLYTCIKALKYIPGPGVRWAFTGPLILWLLIGRVLSNFRVVWYTFSFSFYFW